LICGSPIETRRLVLATLADEHAYGPYLLWMNDPEVTQFLESRDGTFEGDDLRSFIQTCNRDPNVLLLGIFTKEERRHVGNIKLGPVVVRHRRGDLGLVIGDKTKWRQGIASEAIAGVTAHAFEMLDIHKTTAGCHASNEGSRRAFLKAGWHEEARRPMHCRYRDRWDDIILLARFKDAAMDPGNRGSIQGSITLQR